MTPADSDDYATADTQPSVETANVTTALSCRCLPHRNVSLSVANPCSTHASTKTANIALTYQDSTHMCQLVCPRYRAVGIVESRACRLRRSSWLGVRSRGLTGVRLVIADAHAGLGAAADRTIQGAGR